MKNIFLPIFILFFFTFSICAQSSETKQNSLVVKLSATWCPVCAGAAWTSYNWLLDNVINNAFYFTAHSSSTSRLFSTTSLDIIRNFDLSAYQPAFYLNGVNKGTGGSVTEKEIKNTIEDAVTVAPSAFLKTVAKSTGNASIKAQVTVTFPKSVTGNYSIGLYLVEKSVQEIQTGLSGIVEHKNVLRNSFFTQSFGEPLVGTSFPAGYTNSVTGNINLPANSLASNFEVTAVLWNKKTDKYEFVNVNATSDMAGVLTSLSEKLDEGFIFQCTKALKDEVEFQFSSQSTNTYNVNVQLRDILGRSVMNQSQIKLTNELQQINFTHLNLIPGTYILSFESKDFIISRKMVVR